MNVEKNVFSKQVVANTLFQDTQKTERGVRMYFISGNLITKGKKNVCVTRFVI